MVLLYDKFNIIQKEENDTYNDYKTLIDNYVENYLETETNVVHPDYIHQLLWNNKIATFIITDVLKNKLTNYLTNLKNAIKNLIKKNKFEIGSGLNKIIDDYKNKNMFLNNLFKITSDEHNILFEKIILSEPLLIAFFESTFNKINYDIKNDIVSLLSKIKNINNNIFIWFLKCIGTSLIKNKQEITIDIPNKKYVEFNMLITNINLIYIYYGFLHLDILYIINVFVDTFIFDFNYLLLDDNFKYLYVLIKNKWTTVNKCFSNITKYNEVIKPLFTSYFSTRIKKINNYDNSKLYDFLNLIIIGDKVQIVDKHIFCFFEDFSEKILILINEYINVDHIFINNLAPYFIYIKEKDVFIDNFHKELIKRLLSSNTNISYELELVCLINSLFGENIKKVYNTINDYIISQNELNDFNKNNNLNLSLITMSYSNWNINWSNGYIDNIDINTGIYKYISMYNEYYTNINAKKKLLWLPQYGQIEIIYNDIEIILFPIQLMVLESFTDKDEITIDTIKNEFYFKNYSDIYKMNIIKSLIIGGILNNKNNILTISNNVIYTNMINVYFSNLSEHIEIITESNYEIIQTRKYCISSWINHFIKINSLSYLELYSLVKMEIKLFTLNDEMFLNTINWMIDNDYIEEKNYKYIKLLY